MSSRLVSAISTAAAVIVVIAFTVGVVAAVGILIVALGKAVL